ncbi:hypothetical protein [Staphylococcus pseudintermedius]|uniref:hypothetical protein n=1 Tax=Staphylococcus pseudintermedius TaxID=283734 RepID=UPI000BBBE075|nr:hypothetical protein [Staphylococcus pseudintermedius]MDU9262166.1 hypothetical protein [Staphylococcus pseudintermedius]PCE56539.1 hypothetical protein BSR35_07805 [Staphylococcus pseudintermedius]PWZ84624.1 hypothetical protein DD879_12090 [Staphylococcus pseudintermedius]QDX53350.1 hypothetical protein DNH96_11010 [Staphylococcus pseudintermedius]HAR6276280.1 hypothetical protein [Staphylococcus pseudintermedius]
MQEHGTKAIYYFYDEEGNRRLWSVTNLNETVVSGHKARIEFFKKKNPDLDNLFVQIDAVEFKLL